MHRACLATLVLAGCAAPPDQGLVDVAVTKTPEQIRAENQADIESARQALEYQAYVCSLPDPERRELIKKTAAEQNWQIICRD